jgi:serine protease DegQ
VSLNDKPIQSFSQLRATVATMGVGKTIRLGIMREGKPMDVTVSLKKDTHTVAAAKQLHPALDGAQLENNTDPQGVMVSRIDRQSPAMRLGLKEGDVIIGLNRQTVSDVASLQAILKQSPDIIALNIQRGNAVLYLILR